MNKKEKELGGEKLGKTKWEEEEKEKEEGEDEK